MKTSLFLTAIAGSVLASAADCPAAGSTDSKGRYSCNPAHQYPNGQTCGTIDGCYYLMTADGMPVDNTSSGPQPTQSATPCPAAGSTDSKGRYSCNPAHQYPAGQTCIAVDGCYYLDGNAGKTNTTTTPVVTPVVTAGAGTLQVGSMLGLVALVAFL